MDDEEDEVFLCGRAGDTLLCPFECEGCLYFKLTGRRPVAGDPRSDRVIAILRRANLDAFWARSTNTVRANLRGTMEAISLGDELGIVMLEAPGPWPIDFDHGTRAALVILERSKRAGRHEVTMKFSAARKARSVFSNNWMRSPKCAESASYWRSDTKRMVAGNLPTDTEWFTRFIAGTRNRMGVRIRQDLAISIEVMLRIQNLFEIDWGMSNTKAERRKICEGACFCLFAYCGSLRGWEVTKTVLGHLRNQCCQGEGTTPGHVGLPLSGRFKARPGMIQNLLIPIAATTRSGLEPLKWAVRLIQELEEEGVTSGWAFQDDKGRQMKMSNLEERVFEKLQKAQDDVDSGLIPKEIDVEEDFGLARSFRRGATSRAQAAGVRPEVVEWINRWRINLKDLGLGMASLESTGPMRVHYSETRLMLNMFLEFSSAL